MDVVMEKTVKGEDLLLAAKRQLAKADGWRRGSLGSIGKPMCAIGALQHVLTGNPQVQDGDAQDTLESILASCIPGAYDGPAQGKIVNYNDQPGRTKKEILSLFSRAIEKAKKIK